MTHHSDSSPSSSYAVRPSRLLVPPATIKVCHSRGLAHAPVTRTPPGAAAQSQVQILPPLEVIVQVRALSIFGLRGTSDVGVNEVSTKVASKSPANRHGRARTPGLLWSEERGPCPAGSARGWAAAIASGAAWSTGSVDCLLSRPAPLVAPDNALPTRDSLAVRRVASVSHARPPPSSGTGSPYRRCAPPRDAVARRAAGTGPRQL